MTTTVTIEPHCSKEKEVLVAVLDTINPVREFRLQDGEKFQDYVYDGREISVKEVLK